MEKRFQVFVSSTWADLEEERQQVIQTLMEMDCIPAGMELFPAADEEQWEFIKKVINDCDYYLLIIGGRYGSTTEEGISYTEKEYDYAVEQGLRVVALIHGAPEDIPLRNSEQDPALRDKLSSFRAKAMKGRLVKLWETGKELPGLVALSMTKTIKMYPAIGWVRANNAANEDILQEINALRKENSELQEALQEATSQQGLIIDGLANIDSEFTIHGTYQIRLQRGVHRGASFQSTLSWKEMFSLIAPYLIGNRNDDSVQHQLAIALCERETKSSAPHTISINDQEFKTVSIQFKAYGLIRISKSKTTRGGSALFWRLTDRGEQLMIESRVIRENT